jgi:outer membrane protein OmpA-like peptidoglycan-associated protein
MRGGVGGTSDATAGDEEGAMSLYGDAADGEDDEFSESTDGSGAAEGAAGTRRSAAARRANGGAASSGGDAGAAGGQDGGSVAGGANGGRTRTAGGPAGTAAGSHGGGAGDAMAGADGTVAGNGGGARAQGGAAGGAGATSGVGAGGSTAGGVGDEQIVVGMVDAPGRNVQVEEQVTPQTLGGMLPMTIGVDEEGQFDFDQAVLRPEVKQVLDELVARLRDAEWDRLDLIGYTDRIGTTEYNQQLSERRAWAVARYLVDQGVPLNKIKVEGRGERESLVGEEECTSLTRDALIACLQKDRRVSIEASIRKTQANVH